MTYEEVPHRALPCPECRMNKVGGKARIGNRRSQCTTCNNFAQNVMRETRKRLKALHEDEYSKIRIEVEVELYRSLMERVEEIAVRLHS